MSDDDVFQRLDQVLRKITEVIQERDDLRQILAWCVDNDGECLADHPLRLKRARALLEHLT